LRVADWQRIRATRCGRKQQVVVAGEDCGVQQGNKNGAKLRTMQSAHTSLRNCRPLCRMNEMLTCARRRREHRRKGSDSPAERHAQRANWNEDPHADIGGRLTLDAMTGLARMLAKFLVSWNEDQAGQCEDQHSRPKKSRAGNGPTGRCGDKQTTTTTVRP
jgi:hypothetical protein